MDREQEVQLIRSDLDAISAELSNVTAQLDRHFRCTKIVPEKTTEGGVCRQPAMPFVLSGTIRTALCEDHAFEWQARDDIFALWQEASMYAVRAATFGGAVANGHASALASSSSTMVSAQKDALGGLQAVNRKSRAIALAWLAGTSDAAK